MKLFETSTPIEFEAWGGAMDTLDRISEEGKWHEFNTLALKVFANDEDLTKEQFNSWLWFERDGIYDQLGIKEKFF